MIDRESESQFKEHIANAQRLIRDCDGSMSKEAVKANLVEPILKILKWNPDSSDVWKNYRIKRKTTDYDIDYALMVESKPKIFIDVKELKNGLYSAYVMHLMRYISNEESVYLYVLTNGAEWRVYEVQSLRDIVFSIGLDEACIDFFWLLSKGSIESGLLDQELDVICTIKKVQEYIEENKEKWVSDIEAMSRRSSREGIRIILDNMIKTEILWDQPYTLFGHIITPPPGYRPLFDSMGNPKNYTRRKILSLWFRGRECRANSWGEFILELCNIIIHEQGKYKFRKVLEVRGRTRPYFTYNESESQLRKPERIPNTNISMETNLSALNAASICEKLLSKFGYRIDDVRLKVR